MIVSMALLMMKFLLDFRPRIGFSFGCGTLGFLYVESYEKFLTGGKVLSPIVPVCFFLYCYGDGFLSCLRYPKVDLFPNSVCA